jgi:hypothetical protein
MRCTPVSWPLALCAFFVVTACGSQGASAGGPARPEAGASANSGQPPRNQCNAQAAQFLVGQPFGAGTLAQALAVAGADSARMLRPDSLTTREYRAGRLNLVVDSADRVVRVHCG